METLISTEAAQAIASTGQQATVVFDDFSVTLTWPTGVTVTVGPNLVGSGLVYTLTDTGG